MNARESVSAATSVRPIEVATILVVEADDEIARTLCRTLGERYRVVAVRGGREALAILVDLEPRLVLLAAVLPDVEGLDLCRDIRERGSVPVIMVSGDGAETEVVASLEAGADAYVTKPYRWHELAARVGAALRRTSLPYQFQRRLLVAGDVSLDVDRHEVRVQGALIELPLREFQLLEVFLSNPGKLFPRDVLMRRLWGETPASGTKSVDVHVKRIRDRIEVDPSAPTRILTVRGIGYVYAGPVSGTQSVQRNMEHR